MDKQLRNKYIKEGVILVVVLVLVGVVGAFQFGWFSGSEPVPTAGGPIETEFNHEAYERIQTRHDNFPTINLEGLGKDNPFAP